MRVTLLSIILLVSFSCSRKQAIIPEQSSGASQKEGEDANQSDDSASNSENGNEQRSSSQVGGDAPFESGSDTEMQSSEGLTEGSKSQDILLLNLFDYAYSLPQESPVAHLSLASIGDEANGESIEFRVVGGPDADKFEVRDKYKLFANSEVSIGSEYVIDIEASNGQTSYKKSISFLSSPGHNAKDILSLAELAGSIEQIDNMAVDGAMHLSLNPGSRIKIPIFSQDSYLLKLDCHEGSIRLELSSGASDYPCTALSLTTKVSGNFATIANVSESPAKVNLFYLKPENNQLTRSFTEEALFDSKQMNANIFVDNGGSKSAADDDQGRHQISFSPQTIASGDIGGINYAYHYIFDFKCTGSLKLGDESIDCIDDKNIRRFMQGRYFTIENPSDQASSIIDLKVSLMLNPIGSVNSQAIQAENALKIPSFDEEGSIRVVDDTDVSSSFGKAYNAVKLNCKSATGTDSGLVDIDRLGGGYVGQVSCSESSFTWSKVFPLEADTTNGITFYLFNQVLVKDVEFLQAF